jgi:hypothetical protein
LTFFFKDLNLANTAAAARGLYLPMGSRAAESIRAVLRERKNAVRHSEPGGASHPRA